MFGQSMSFSTISNGNRTERSEIRSVIIRVITKSDNRANYQLIIKITISERIRLSQVMKERENLH